MPRIRTVKPEFFKHFDLYSLEETYKLPVRLAFQGLWLCADKEGRFRWLPQQLKLDVLPYDKVDFGEVLEILKSNGFLEKYEVGGKSYGLIPTFKEHQRIQGSESHKESKIPAPGKQQGNIEEAPWNEDGSTLDHRKGREGKGREGKGREKEGKGDVPPPFQDDTVTYNAEEEILKNQIEWQRIVMTSKKEEPFARDSLHKYHLWLADKDLYPKKRKTIFPGFEKWLNDEKYSKNGTHKQSVTRNDKSTEGASHAYNAAVDRINARGTKDG